MSLLKADKFLSKARKPRPCSSPPPPPPPAPRALPPWLLATLSCPGAFEGPHSAGPHNPPSEPCLLCAGHPSVLHLGLMPLAWPETILCDNGRTWLFASTYPGLTAKISADSSYKCLHGVLGALRGRCGRVIASRGL